MDDKWDGINRRRHIRVEFPYTLHIFTPDKEAISAYIEDISEVGIKTCLRKKIEASTLLELEIYLKDTPVICQGKVVWVKEVKSQHFKNEYFFYVGVEFEKLSDKDRDIIKRAVVSLKMKRP